MSHMRNLLAVLVLLLVVSCRTITQPNASMLSPEVIEQVTEELPVEEEVAVKLPVVDHKTYALHEVGSLDTVASVARKYDISPEQLIQLNNLAPPYSIRAGSVIKVPASTQPSIGRAETPDDEGVRTIHIKPKVKVS